MDFAALFNPSILAVNATRFAQATISKIFGNATTKFLNLMYQNQNRYKAVQAQTGVPWYFIACIHMRESDMLFTRHLHNGDPLTARTIHVPAGRPIAPPKNGKVYTWEESAIDVIRFKGLDKNKDWSTAAMLRLFEAYNGLGYQMKGLPSPYVWSGTQFYQKGKYVADGVFNATAVDQQLGAGTLLKAYLEDQKKKPNPLGVLADRSRDVANTFLYFITGKE